MSSRRLVLCLISVLLALQANAHHSFSAIFDGNHPIEITGTIYKVYWTNPHSYVHLMVKEKDGSSSEWSFESLPPAFFKRAGLKREMLPIGDTVTITGFAARDGTQHLGWIKKFKFADGREIVVTSENPENARFE